MYMIHLAAHARLIWLVCWADYALAIQFSGLPAISLGAGICLGLGLGLLRAVKHQHALAKCKLDLKWLLHVAIADRAVMHHPQLTMVS